MSIRLSLKTPVAIASQIHRLLIRCDDTGYIIGASRFQQQPTALRLASTVTAPFGRRRSP
ncbi:hypothetical protein IFO70_30905 [Phormidium tenue FACHB-886]|nr:hypothetical protein [Phormidium tenue FACHB-886]